MASRSGPRRPNDPVIGRLFIDGEPAIADDLAHPALVGYGAYTSFRVEGGAVRGLSLHLDRLAGSAGELFGAAPSEARLRDLMRQALDGRPEAWLRVSLFSPEIGHRSPIRIGEPRVMVGVFDPPAPLAGGVRVQPQVHQRFMPHLKHTATFDLIRARRTARASGFDDALFVDDQGQLSEGTLWNLGFVSGDTVVWPAAPMLDGVTRRLIETNLVEQGLRSERTEVRLDDLSRFDAAFLCNSATPAASIAAIGEHVFAERPDLTGRLTAAWTAAAPEPI